MQQIEETSHDKISDEMQSKEELLSKLRVFISDMKAAEQLVVPTLHWNPKSAESKEALAVARTGVLISSYEPQYFWYDMK